MRENALFAVLMEGVIVRLVSDGRIESCPVSQCPAVLQSLPLHLAVAADVLWHEGRSCRITVQVLHTLA